MECVARCNGVVPFRVKGIALNVESGHFSGGDLDTLLVSVGVQFAFDRQAGRRGGSGDQFDHGEAAGQGAATPVLRDMAEKAMLASRAGESHPHALLEPYVNLSIHTAPDVRPLTCRNPQWTKRFGLLRTTRVNHSLAPFGRGRRRLNLLRAQRIRKASILRNVQDSADL